MNLIFYVFQNLVVAMKYRQGPKNVLYSIGFSPAQFQANQEQAKQALTPVLISQSAPD